MTEFDLVVLSVVGISLVLSILRGLVREILALAGWVVAFLVASHFAVPVAPMLPASVPGESLRLVAAFVGLFLSCLLLMTFVTLAAAELVKSLGLGAADKVLGAVFGLLRGLVIVLVVVMLAGMTSVPQQPFWRHAMLSAPLEALVVKFKPWLPEGFSKRLNYE